MSPEEELQACRVERDAALHQLRQVSERLHEMEDHQQNSSPVVLCESCEKNPATHCVTFGFTQFWVCEGCTP